MVKAFDTRNSGQKAKIFASEMNKFIKTSQIVDDNLLNLRTQQGTTNTEKQIIFLENDSAVDIPQYGVVMIKDIIFLPADNEDEFKFRFGLKGGDYIPAETSGEDTLKFMIAQTPIAIGEVGKGMINGTTQAKIIINNENHRYVRPLKNGFLLETAQSGPARIQYKEPGVGEKWAIIQMATSDNQRIKVSNVGAQEIPEGGAMQITSMTGPDEFSVQRPDADNLIHVLPNTGPPIPAGNKMFIDVYPMMRFKVNSANIAKMPPGANIGVSVDVFELDISRFGFLVYGIDTVSPNGPYAYCGLNGIVSLLTAVSDEDAGKIDVERSDVTGVGDGDTFELDVVTEP